MRKWIALVLSFLLIFNISGATVANAEDTFPDFLVDGDPEFASLDDPAFLQYMEDSIYAQLEAEFADNEAVFQVDEVTVTFISKEYLEETAYNSKANVFFGYTLSEINEAFQDKKYVFTLSDDGETVVQEFLEIPDDTYDRVIKNVLIGVGIILICVTVTVCTAGSGAPLAATGITPLAGTLAAGSKVHMIFAASASSATKLATGSAFFTGMTTFIVRGFETGWDLDAMTDSALLQSSESFKWGAISGAVVGGGGEALKIYRASRSALTSRQAEQAAHALYGGREQVSYFNGEEVTYGLTGSVKPDIVVGNEAIEVKCYDLTQRANVLELRTTLQTEIAQRVIHLPKGMTQRVVLNVEGRGYTADTVQNIVAWLKHSLEPIYPDIPIDVMGAMY